MADNFEYDVFLSHNAKDKPRVRRLAERLKQAGLRVWFDEWNIKPGEIISLKVDEGLIQSRVLLLCLSPNALASNWVALERSTAIHRDPSNKDRRFIPLLLADCDLPDTLSRYKYVDFREESQAAFESVMNACGYEAAQVDPTPTRKSQTKKKQTRTAKRSEMTELVVMERKLMGHKGRVWSVVTSADGKWAISGADDNTLRIWNLANGKCVATLEGHTKSIEAVAITPDGKRIVSGSSDYTVRIWDSSSGVTLATTKAKAGRVISLAFTQGGAKLLLGCISSAERIELLEFPTLKSLWAVATQAGVRSLHANDNSLYFVVGHADGTLTVRDLETGNCLTTLYGHSDVVHSIKITPDGKFAVSGSTDKTIRVWDLEAQTCLGVLEGHQQDVHSVAVSPDGTLIASSGFIDSTVRLWDLKSGICLQIIEHKELWIPISVAWSTDGFRLLVGATNGSLYVYRFTGQRPPSAIHRTLRYVNAKVVLLGEGTVGKTSLAHRLIEDKYVVRDRTHGMNVWRLDLPLAPNATIEREALLWDLAGQEDYRLIHQLFLDETALALLLINPQKDNPFVEAGDWLKALKTAATEREAAKLLIFSQVDVGEPKLGNAKIDRFCKEHGFAEWLLTSAKNGRNCSDQKNRGEPSRLKQLIATSIPWDKLPWTTTPRLLGELKNALVAMRDEQDIRLLRFAELTQRLEQALPNEKFAESDVRTAVTLLANHGLARLLKFGDLVLLQPELLNGYAGAIIRAARANKDEIGSVLEADIYKPNFDFTGVERLKHRSDEELLLHALVQTFLDHSLCIAEDLPNGRHLVFPSQYRREKDIPHDPDIFVSYTFSGEWQTVWTTLVVRLWYSQEFKHKELWRNAAEFASPKGFTLGLKIDNKQGEGTATVSLYFDKEVHDDLKAIFIEYVHRHLAKFGCEVSRDRRYVCSECGKPVKDLDEVRKRLDANKDFIYCQGCDEKVPLIDFIEQHVKSDPVARKILAMDATATRELDTQALEQILIGHMMATCGEANQIFRPTPIFDYGIDGEVEFKDNNGKASGKRIYIQLKSGNSYLRKRKSDGSEVFDVKNERHLEYWISQPVDVYLVIRQTDEATAAQSIRWMNVTRYLKERKDKKSRQIIFAGEKLDMEAVWKVRDQFFPPTQRRK